MRPRRALKPTPPRSKCGPLNFFNGLLGQLHRRASQIMRSPMRKQTKLENLAEVLGHIGTILKMTDVEAALAADQSG